MNNKNDWIECSHIPFFQYITTCMRKKGKKKTAPKSPLVQKASVTFSLRRAAFQSHNYIVIWCILKIFLAEMHVLRPAFHLEKMKKKIFPYCTNNAAFKIGYWFIRRLNTVGVLGQEVAFSRLWEVACQRLFFTAGRRPRCLGTASCHLVIVVLLLWDVTVGKM